MEQKRKVISGRVDVYRAFEVDSEGIGIDTHLFGERGGVLVYIPGFDGETNFSFYHTVYDAVDVLADKVDNGERIHFPDEAGFFSHETEQGIRRFIANPMSPEDQDYFMGALQCSWHFPEHYQANKILDRRRR